MVLMNLAMEGWDITTFMTNLAKTLQTWGGLFFVVIGVVMIIWSIYKVAHGLMSQRGGDINWFKILIAFLVGGALVAAGGKGAWTFVEGIAKGGKTTLDELGGGATILFSWLRYPWLR